MIEAKDLRIGNYLNYRNGDDDLLVNVLSIGPHLAILAIGTNDEHGDFMSFYDKVYGIPLTEELLLKMGFEKVYCSEYNWLFELTNDISFEYKFNFMEHTQHLIWKSRVIPCLMVHDLQNIVQLLGKQELTLS